MNIVNMIIDIDSVTLIRNIGFDNEPIVSNVNGFDWIKVRTLDNSEGWVAIDFLLIRK